MYSAPVSASAQSAERTHTYRLHI